MTEPQKMMASSTGASWKTDFSSPTKGSGSLARSPPQSTAPLMRAFTGSSPSKTFQQTGSSTVAPGTSFHSTSMPSLSSSSLGTPKKHQGYRPLGDAWRTTGSWNPNRSYVSEGDSFIGGSVPSFIKGHQCRTKEAIGHHLGWAYYRTKRHPDHPLRIAFGANTLPATDVVSGLRDNTPDAFNFWRDLRPPFDVVSVRRIEQPDDGEPRRPQEHYEVEFECSLDYKIERSWGEKQDGGTFDNKIHGTVLVQLADKWPTERPLEILHWGPPCLNYTPNEEDKKNFKDDRPAWHCWLPLAKELNDRPTASRFKSFRVTDNFKHDYVQPKPKLDPVTQALLGRHDFQKIQKGTSKMEAADRKKLASSPKKSLSPKKGGSPFAADLSDSKDTPKRRNSIFTAAAGFVRYDG